MLREKLDNILHENFNNDEIEKNIKLLLANMNELDKIFNNISGNFKRRIPISDSEN